MKNTLLFLALILFSNLSFAQFNQIQISGRVLSETDGLPLPYAYVKLEGLAIGTVTNANGFYSLRVSSGYAENNLVFSYLGYEKQAFQINLIEDRQNFVVKLRESPSLLGEVVIEPRKQISPQQLWKQVVKNISENYSSEPFEAKGYYRETVKENDAYMKFADASCEFYLAPYEGKDLDKEIKRSNYNGHNTTSGYNFSSYWGERMHRGHFSGETILEDQVKIMEARTSANLTKKGMTANVEGGPIGLIGKDRMKYLRYFADKRNWDKYSYDVKETQDADGNWQYVLSFEPSVSAEEIVERQSKIKLKENFKNTLDSLFSAIKNAGKRYKIIQKMIDKPIAGKIYINQANFAVSKISYSVPKDYKKFICAYQIEAIKHFDYKIDIDYQKIGGIWYPKSIRQEDEFIYIDTTGGIQTTTPYKAILELTMGEIRTENAKPFHELDIFANSDMKTLYDYPTSYDSSYWKAYELKNPLAKISSEIRKEMGEVMELEQQFIRRFARKEEVSE